MIVPEGFESYPQFIIHRNKIPINPDTGHNINPHDPKEWLTAVDAQAVAVNRDFGVGFVFTNNDPFWFIDIDGCLVNGQWSPLAVEICNLFPHAACEVSLSGTGLHLFGSGIVPPHSCKNTNLHMELYTTGRYVALTGIHARGSALYAHDLTQFVTTYFPPDVIDMTGPTWTDGPVPEWQGNVDDETLIQRALRSNSPNSAFGQTASFADLWTAQTAVLSKFYPDPVRPYDCSSVDAALAQRLAFWTGKDCERIRRLMRKSGLVRDKWEREDYLVRTIIGAVSRQVDVLQDKPLETVAHVEPAVDVPLSSYVTGNTFANTEQQIELFAGCVYILDSHRVLVPKGLILNQNQFKVHFGGYRFTLDTANEKTTKDPWEAFTQNQAYRCPRVHSEAFKPNLPPGTIIERGGRRYVNTFYPVDVPRKPGDVTPFLEHLAKVLPVENDRLIFLSYMAACVQYQGTKFQWAPLLQGVEGNGKTLFTRCVAEAIGRHYVHWPKASKLSKDFNGWMHRKILYGVEDIFVPAHKREVIEELKPMITGGDGLEIESKGVDQISADICGNFMFNSNHADAIRKTKNDRRFCVFFSAQQQAADLIRDGMTGDYFPNLYEWLREDGYAFVTDYLFTYPIPDEYNPATKCQRAPMTSSTSTAIAASIGGVEQEIQEAIAQGAVGFCGGFISSIMLQQLLERIRAANRITHTMRKDLLLELGYVLHPALPNGRVNNTVMPDNGRPRLFVHMESEVYKMENGLEVVKAYENANTIIPFIS